MPIPTQAGEEAAGADEEAADGEDVDMSGRATRSKTAPQRKEATPLIAASSEVITLSDVQAARDVLADKANQHWVKGLGGGQNKESETIVNFLYKLKVGPGKSPIFITDRRTVHLPQDSRSTADIQVGCSRCIIPPLRSSPLESNSSLSLSGHLGHTFSTCNVFTPTYEMILYQLALVIAYTWQVGNLRKYTGQTKQTAREHET